MWVWTQHADAGLGLRGSQVTAMVKILLSSELCLLPPHLLLLLPASEELGERREDTLEREKGVGVKVGEVVCALKKRGIKKTSLKKQEA